MKKIIPFLLLFFAFTSYDVQGQATCDAETIDVTSNVLNGETDNQHAETILTAENTIDSGGVAHYKAGTSITLKAGFHAKLGSEFSATIEACTPPSGTFVTKWETTGTNESINIPTYSGETYSYTVDWGDLSTDTIIYTGDASHTYSLVDDYTVTITGVFPRIYFNNTGDKDKIIEIVDWGDMVWSSMENAFYGCSQLDVTDTDAPDLTGGITDLSGMFRDCSVLTQDVSNWDVSGITNMSHMFSGAGDFNRSLADWDIDSINNMTGMLDNSDLDLVNYDETLESWRDQAVLLNITNITLGANGLEGCNSFYDREDLINNYGWVINGDINICARSLSTTVEELTEFSIYPNPATDRIQVSNTTQNNIVVQIVDVAGRVVLKKQNQKSIDISGLKAGVYFVQIFDDEKKIVKLIKL
ncbi:MAG: BspA family leucine-rich repeat surface protein, partial [Flavobacteriaceae bacterium]|nr:BspA family leucine-rich repeat surface protein [Flavobacteriaceae bacterium]